MRLPNRHPFPQDTYQQYHMLGVQYDRLRLMLKIHTQHRFLNSWGIDRMLRLRLMLLLYIDYRDLHYSLGLREPQTHYISGR